MSSRDFCFIEVLFSFPNLLHFRDGFVLNLSPADASASQNRRKRVSTVLQRRQETASY
jgi:hypothetical protein